MDNLAHVAKLVVGLADGLPIEQEGGIAGMIENGVHQRQQTHTEPRRRVVPLAVPMRVRHHTEHAVR